MLNSRLPRLGLIGGVLGAATLFSPAAHADSAQALFDSLFARDLQRVSATPDSADDLELARQMLGVLDKTQDPAMRKLLCRNAVTLAGRDPEGPPAVLQALNALAELDPAGRAEDLRHAITTLNRLYTASRGAQRTATGEQIITLSLELADVQSRQENGSPMETLRRAQAMAASIKSDSLEAVKSAIAAAAARQRTLARVRQIKQQLELRKDPAAAAELVRLLVVDLDDAPAAAEFAGLVSDPALASGVKLAAQPLEKLEAAQCGSLGDWYRDLAASSPADSRRSLLERARVCYRRGMKLHTDTDPLTLKLSASVKEVRAKLLELDQASPAAGWIDLMPRVRGASDSDAGWVRHAAGPLVSDGSAPLRLPVEVTGGYEVQFQFIRRSNAPITLTMPVSGGYVALTLFGYGQNLTQLTASPSQELIPPAFANNVVHGLAVRVVPQGELVQVTGEIDGKPLVRAVTRPRKENPPTPGPSIGGKFSVSALRIQALGGKVRPTRGAAFPDVVTDDPSAVALSTMTPVEARGFGDPAAADNAAAPAAPTVASFTPVEIDGKASPESLGAQPGGDVPAAATYELDGTSRWLVGGVGLLPGEPEYEGDATFTVLGDGRKLWQSKPLPRPGVVQMFKVNVAGVKRLTLSVLSDGDPQHCRGVWYTPKLIGAANGKP